MPCYTFTSFLHDDKILLQMNSKQSKQSTSPAVSKPQPARPGSSQPRPDNPSHFQWPVSSQATSFPGQAGANMGGANVGAPSHQIPQSSNYNQQSVSSMLPPINALSQPTRLPTQQLPPSSGYHLTSPASLSSYSANGGAATNPLVNYPYSQFPMFGMGTGLPDMATMNPSTLTGLAMQYYRQDSSGHGANNAPGM